jgi:hypothetical protein
MMLLASLSLLVAGITATILLLLSFLWFLMFSLLLASLAIAGLPVGVPAVALVPVVAGIHSFAGVPGVAGIPGVVCVLAVAHIHAILATLFLLVSFLTVPLIK